MKWILLVLLAVNLGLGGYFYWQQSQPVTEPTEVASSAQFNNLAPSAGQLSRLSNVVTVAAEEQDPVVEQCVRITGLIEGDSLPVIASRLKALEINTTQEIDRKLIKQDYQVLLGPFDSQAEARAELDNITARNIEGYVITSGDAANSLSLGVFSNENNANRRLAELQAVNVSAKIITKELFAETVVLQIDHSSARLISDETLQSMLSGFEDADFLRYNCN